METNRRDFIKGMLGSIGALGAVAITGKAPEVPELPKEQIDDSNIRVYECLASNDSAPMFYGCSSSNGDDDDVPMIAIRFMPC
jgi:hypothetical protein